VKVRNFPLGLLLSIRNRVGAVSIRSCATLQRKRRCAVAADSSWSAFMISNGNEGGYRWAWYIKSFKARIQRFRCLDTW
jgi:hypothetical protein